MSTTKHTPGPWKAHPDRYITTDDANLERIAKVADSCDDVEVTDERANADAHLIAAAPLMYEALEQVREVVNMSDPEHENYADSCADVVEALCLIFEQFVQPSLSKARGES
jgi:hypothetical protein